MPLYGHYNSIYRRLIYHHRVEVEILQKVGQEQRKEMLCYDHSRNRYWSHTSYSQIPQIIIKSRETSYPHH